MKRGGYIIIIMLAFTFSGCKFLLMSKAERIEARGNRKLENLVAKYPKLISQDTIRDTIEVIIPEVHIDTIIKINNNTDGVDSLLNKFEGRLDSLTRIQLGDEIKYYVTNKQVIEDTLIYTEGDITVSVWQDGDLIRIKVDKPEQIIEKPIEVVHDQIVLNKDEGGDKWYKLIMYCLTVIVVLIILKYLWEWKMGKK